MHQKKSMRKKKLVCDPNSCFELTNRKKFLGFAFLKMILFLWI